MYFCICNDTGKNIIGQIQSGNENELTAQSILNQYCSGSNTLWLKTERFAYALQPDDHPFVDYPNLILSTKPENSTPATAFYTFPNYDSTSKVLYFLPKHDTNQKIPRLTIVIPQSDLGSDLTQLSTIIEQSFITPANVKEILINDEPLNGNITINDVFENAKNGKEIAVSLSFDEVCIQKIRQRENLCNEIVYSENNFVNDLTVINNDWKKMFEEENFLAETDFRALFNDIPMILGVHTKFSQMLKENLDGYGSQFSVCFIQYHPFFKSSINYITNYPSINEILTLKENQPDYNKRCKEMAQQLKGRDLASYLITPVQRIPRYLLFLRELSKLTPKNHPDYLYLSQAVQTMTNLTQEIDRKTETAEKQNVLYNIQLRNYTDFVYCAPARKVIKIYDTLIKSRSLEGNLVVCDDYVFLIDKPDMYCRFRAPLDAFPVDFLKDGLSFKVLNTDEPDNLVETTVQMNSKEDLEEFQKYINDASINNFNSTSGDNESILWEVSPLTERAPRLCKHSGVYVKNKEEEYYLFYGGYTVKSDEHVDDTVETRTITYQRNNTIYCFTPPDQFKEISSGIPGRYNHRLVYVNNKFFIIGGSPSSQTFYVYDNNQQGEQLGWRKVNAPELDLTGHAAVQHQNRIYIYGGTPFKDDVYELNTDNYSLKTYNDFPEGQKPEQRTNHSAVIYNNKLYVYGGTDNIGRPLSDLWCFDLETKKWEMKGNFDSPKAGHQGLLLGNEYVIVGGRPKGDTISINLDTLEKKVVKDFGNYPSGLNGFAVAVGDNNTALVYGGVESTSKSPKNTVYTLKLNNDWNQKATNEESKNSELVAEKSQQTEREPILTSFKGVNLDVDDLPEAENNEIVDDSLVTSSLLSESLAQGPGNGDLEPWTLTPEEADDLIKRIQEGKDISQEQPAVKAKDDVELDNIEHVESGSQKDTENSVTAETPTPAEGENRDVAANEEGITNGDDMPWTLSPEEADNLLKQTEEEEKSQEQAPSQTENANEPNSTENAGANAEENAGANAEENANPEENANQDWILDPDAEKDDNKPIDDGLIESGNQFEVDQSKDINKAENANPEEEEKGGNKADQDNVETNEEEDKQGGNKFEPDNENANKGEEEEFGGNQFEVDNDELLNCNEEEEQGGNKFEPDNENQNKEEEEITAGNQFEPDEDKELNNKEEEEQGGNKFEPDDDNQNKEEEEITAGNQFEPDQDKNMNNKEEEEQGGNDNQHNEEENENQAPTEEEGRNENQVQIEEEEEENENQNDNNNNQQDQENRVDQDNQQDQNNQENTDNNENQDNNSQGSGKHPSKKYQFQFEYRPSEEEEDESDQLVRPPKRKPEWSFEMPEEPPRKFNPIFYPETPGSRKRKKNQPKKKSNSQMSPTGGASGKPPIFSVSGNNEYYNYNNYNSPNNNSSLNYSLNNSIGGYSPFSPNRPRPASPKSSLYPNILDDVTPKKKLLMQQEKLRQQQREQRNQRHQDSNEYTSSISSSSALSPQRRSQVHQLQERENNKYARQHPQQQQQQPMRRPNEKVSPKRWKVTPSRNPEEPHLELEDAPSDQQRPQRKRQQQQQHNEISSESVQSSSLMNSSSEEVPQQQQQHQQKNKLQLSPVSAKDYEIPTKTSTTTTPQQRKPKSDQNTQTSQSKVTTKSANQNEQPQLSGSASLKTETDGDIEIEPATNSSSKPQQKSENMEKSDKSSEKLEAKLTDHSNEEEEEKKSKKDKEKKKDKDKKKDKSKKDKDKKDKDKEKDKEKEKEKDKKEKDKKKDKKKDKDSKKKDNEEEKEKDKKKDKDRKSKRKEEEHEEEKRHHNHHTHKSVNSPNLSMGRSPGHNRYENEDNDKFNDNRRDTQNRSDQNNMTRTNDTTQIILDTSPIRKPVPGARNVNNFNNDDNNNNFVNMNNDNYNYNNNNNRKPKVKKSKFDRINPYYYNKDNNEENIVRRKRRISDDEDNESSDILSFKRNPNFKRAANQFKFDNDNELESSNSNEFKYGARDFNNFGTPSDNKFNQTNGNSNRYFNFKIRGSNPNSNTNPTNTNSQYNSKHRPKQTFMTNYNLQPGQLNCSYLPKFNIYGVNICNNNNNNANANPYTGGVGIGYKPTNYRNDHVRGNRNRYNVIDESDSFNPFSSSF